MKPSKTLGNVVVAALLGVGLTCFTAGCGPSAEPGATTKTSDHEIPGTHDPNDLNPVTAQQWIDQVRVGRGVDQNGEVPESMRTDTFSPEDEINVSMKVADAPAGTRVAVEIRDEASGNTVWSHEATVAPGRSHIRFRVSADEFEQGSYEARVIVGDESVAHRRFAIG